jgi:hypothetical protein
MVFLNMLLVLKNNQAAWPVILFFLFGIAAAGEWIRRGPMPEKLKAYMERKGIRIIHLWVGITAAYYMIVGISEFLGDFA